MLEIRSAAYRGRSTAALALALLLTGCVSPAGRDAPGGMIEIDGQHYRLQRVPRDDAGIVAIAPGWIRHPQLGMLPLHRSDARSHTVRIAVAPASPPPAWRERAAPIASPVQPLQLQPEGELVEHDNGLPRRGQWRDQFELRAAGLGEYALLAPPARKALSPPQRWRRSAVGEWVPWPLGITGRHDYGGIGSGDFNADGRVDVALAMHLRGFVGWLAGEDGGWVAGSTGLPSLQQGADPAGSGVGLAVLPDPDGDRLLLLREAVGAIDNNSVRGYGLAEYRWTGDRWHAEPISPSLVGSGLSLGSVPGCAPLLAVKASANNHLPLFEREQQQWRPLPAPVTEPDLWFVSALHVGDFDRRGCADLAFVRRIRESARWKTHIDVWLRDRGQWQRRTVPVADGRSHASAIHARAIGPDRIELLVGDESGRLDLFRIEPDAAHWIASLPPAAWREGCAVSTIDGWVDALGGRRWVVGFAGDNDIYTPGRCRDGGGLAEFGWRPAR